jgi:hypothetical protein
MGIVGDSKSTLAAGGESGGTDWATRLIAELNADYNSSPGLRFEENVNTSGVRAFANGGDGSYMMSLRIDSGISAFTVKGYADYNLFLLNIGANDFVLGTSEADFKTYVQNAVNDLVGKYANAKILISKPWRRGYGAQADTMAGWIDDLIAANPGVLFFGDDERVWMEGGDDGATMTFDGIHHSDLGVTAKIAAVRVCTLALWGW